MKAGRTIQELAAQLQADKARMKDYVVDTRELNVLTGEAGTELKLPGMDELVPSQHFHRQLGTDLKIRADMYDRLRTKHPALYDNLVNGLLYRWDAEHDGNPGKRLIRTYTDGAGPDGSQGIARSVLSDRYRRIDNFEVAEAVLPIIGKIDGVEIPSCEVTETRMYIKVVAPLTQVNLQDLIEPGVHQFLPDGSPDYVQAGFVLTNSEVGNGALSIEEMIYRLVCKNGLIVGKALRRTHVGSQVQADEDYTVFRDETIAADDKALMMKVQDAVSAAVDETRFKQIAAQFAETTSGEQIAKPVEAMKVLAPMVGLSEEESGNVLQHLITGGDLSRFGTINAITRAAQDVESYDRSTELEQLAASVVMRMPNREWERVAVAA
jgi:hypothetical protein